MKYFLRLILLFLCFICLSGTALAGRGEREGAYAYFCTTEAGRQAYFAALQRRHGVAADAAAQRRVAKIFAQLVPVAGLKQQPLFLLCPETHFNAYALAGDMVLVNQGMVQELTDDDELAFMLAHELAHLALQHPAQGFRQSPHSRHFAGKIRPVVADSFSEKDADNFVLAAEGALLRGNQEQQADDRAFDILCKAGFNANAAASVWHHLRRRFGSGVAFGNHPDYRARAKRMERRIAADRHKNPSAART